MIRIAVQDYGVGMSAEEQKRIWDRFYRSPRHRDTIPGGGLGLWIARAFVMACNGRVEAFSPGINSGTSVSFYLPVQSSVGVERSEAFDD